mmetsp:Transcript_36090/g.55432  ORF Transcript_36090/g.55432 Transcript_36090/m.55432 type:complete len:268 (-) Transcript_36090:311-1114(-)
MVLNSYLVALDGRDLQVRNAGEEVIYCQLFRIPEGLARLGSNTFFILAALRALTANDGPEDIRGAVHEHLGDFLRRLGLSGVGQVGDLAARVVLLHGLDHLVAVLVYLDASERYAHRMELLHQGFELKTVGVSHRIRVPSTVVVLVAMARSVEDVEHLSLGARRPLLVQAFSEAADHVLREISASHGLDVLDEALDRIYVFREVFDAEPLRVAVVAVADEADSHFQVTLAALNHVRYDLLQGLLRSSDPGAHRTGAVAEQAQLEQVC